MIAVYNKRKDFLFDQDQRNERERGKKKQFPLFDVKAKEFISLLINCYKNSVFNYKREAV